MTRRVICNLQGQALSHHAGEILNCICQEPSSSIIGSSLLDTFAAVRERCPAIKELFVPDEIWSKFHNWHLWSDVEAHHESTLLLALDRGYLSSITSPLHRYLLKSGRINSRVRKQYINDLRENWIEYSDPLERQGWEISDLEAFREKGPDIEAKSPSGNLTAFEVKFIGQDNEGFGTVLKSFRGEDAYERRSPYCAVNYLLYRVYQSAKQLQGASATTRITLVVIDEQTWCTFETQLKGGWIDWMNPTFMDVYDPFIDREREANPKLDAELKVILGSINDVWILKRSSGNQFQLMFSQRSKE